MFPCVPRKNTIQLYYQLWYLCFVTWHTITIVWNHINSPIFQGSFGCNFVDLPLWTMNKDCELYLIRDANLRCIHDIHKKWSPMYWNINFTTIFENNYLIHVLLLYSDSKNSRCPGEEHRSHEVHAGPGQNARNPGHNERHVQRNDEGNNLIILYLALYWKNSVAFFNYIVTFKKHNKRFLFSFW